MAKYLLKDRNGIQLASLTGVLDVVSLTGVVTNVTSGTENQVTVDSTAGLFPCMPVSIPNIPEGSFIHAIRSATVIELYRSAWNATTGVFTTSGANAAATAAGSSLVGRAHGFDPRCLVTQIYARGTWRNLLTSQIEHPAVVTNGSANEFASVATKVRAPGLITVLQSTNALVGSYLSNSTTPTMTIMSDNAVSTPLKRHDGAPWACRIVVHTGGHLSTISADPDDILHYNGPDA